MQPTKPLIKIFDTLVCIILVLFLTTACEEIKTTTDSPRSTGSFKIEHAFGNTVIKVIPKRIITASTAYTDALLTLGVNPLATIQFSGSVNKQGYSWQKNKLNPNKTELITITSIKNLPVEKLISLHPDLILSDLITDQATYTQLSKIAPTVPALNNKNWNDSWQDKSKIVGKILGKQKLMLEKISEVNSLLTNQTKIHPNIMGKTVLPMLYSQGNLFVVNDREDPSMQMFSKMGLQLFPPALNFTGGSAGTGILSTENLDKIVTVNLMVMSSYMSSIQDITNSDLFKKSAACKNNTVVLIDSLDSGAIRMPTILSVPWLVNLMQSALQKVR